MTVLTEEKDVDTLFGKFCLTYELLQSRFESDEGEGDFFGIRIRQIKREDSRIVDDSEAKGITEDYEEAERLFAVFVRETVMPVHLLALVDDWQSSVHPA